MRASNKILDRIPRLLFLAALAALPALALADHEAFVVINVTASKEYTQQKMANGAPRPESYVFYQGRFFPGTPDTSIARMTFADITSVLAPNLAKQNYLPTRNVPAADLLIVVNWGTTMTDPATERTGVELTTQYDNLMTSVGSYNSAWSQWQAGTGAMPDPADITSQLTVQQGNQFSGQVVASLNAQLLGYTDTLNKELRRSVGFSSGLDSDAETHLAQLNQERYFVIVLAYDFRQLRQNRGRSKPPLPVWTLRMNVQADGNNFRQALPAMSQVAADYFGKQLEGLQTAQVSVGSRSNVDIGESKVMGEAK